LKLIPEFNTKSMKKNINIIIMGPQGSGKGTQARLLARKYDLQIFETGNVLRSIAKQNTKLGKKIDEIINKKGQFVPWELLRKVIDQQTKNFDKSKGIIFDGTPRRIEEVKYWENKLKQINRKINYIFYISISEEESVKRLSSRKLCKENEHPLIVGKDIKEEDTKCPICGSEIYRREDDTPEKIANRLKWSRRLLDPVIKYYKNKGMLTKINGKQSIEEVHKEIVNYIK
jgi:adenylate kinase